MARPHPLTYLPLLDRALDPDVEIGIGFRVAGIERTQFRNMLYDAAKQSDDPLRYKQLIMFLPGGDHTDEVWVCKKEVELGDA